MLTLSCCCGPFFFFSFSFQFFFLDGARVERWGCQKAAGDVCCATKMLSCPTPSFHLFPACFTLPRARSLHVPPRPVSCLFQAWGPAPGGSPDPSVLACSSFPPACGLLGWKPNISAPFSFLPLEHQAMTPREGLLPSQLSLLVGRLWEGCWRTEHDWRSCRLKLLAINLPPPYFFSSLRTWQDFNCAARSFSRWRQIWCSAC